jgi:hypothetical protein
MVNQISGPKLMGREAFLLRVTQAAARSGVATDGLRVRLSEAADGRVVAQANARAARRAIRVQVAAGTLDQAVEDLADRLGRRVLEAAACWSGRPWPDTDDASVPSRLPRGGPALAPGLPARIKAAPLATCPPEVAVAVMDLMDYPAHLFVDAGTGLDAVVHRAGPTGYRLTRLRPAPPPAPNTVPLTVDPLPAPVLPVARAIARLDESGLGHLLFADPDTGRGQLLYRRFDDRYAIVRGSDPRTASRDA